MKIQKELWSVFIFVLCLIGCNGTFLYNTLTHICIGRSSSVDRVSASRAAVPPPLIQEVQVVSLILAKEWALNTSPLRGLHRHSVVK